MNRDTNIQWRLHALEGDTIFELYFIRAGDGVISHTVETASSVALMVNDDDRIIGLCINEAPERMACQFVMPTLYAEKPPIALAATYDPDENWVTVFFSASPIKRFTSMPEFPDAQYGVTENGLIGGVRILASAQSIAPSMTPEQYSTAAEKMEDEQAALRRYLDTGDKSVFK